MPRSARRAVANTDGLPKISLVIGALGRIAERSQARHAPRCSARCHLFNAENHAEDRRPRRVLLPSRSMTLSNRDSPTCTSEAGPIAAPPISPRSLKDIMPDKLAKKGRVSESKFRAVFCRGHNTFRVSLRQGRCFAALQKHRLDFRPAGNVPQLRKNFWR